MVKNYFKIAWRNIINRKFYTLLNIGGLAVAISCCILIYVFSSYNLSFDTYHNNANNIFRLVYELHLDKTEYDKGASFAEFKTLKTTVPQVQDAAFSVDKQSFVITVNDNINKLFKEDKNVAFTNADWFRLFKYNLIAGNANELNQPGSMVIREKVARKYYGNIDVIGKTLQVNNKPFKITGLIADGPGNTDLKSEIYLSLGSISYLMPLWDKNFYTDWGYINSTNNAYVMLHNAREKNIVESELSALTIKRMGEQGAKYYRFKLLPLNQAHFDTRYGGTVQKSLLWNLLIIGILIICIAIFNYTNITIAQQTRRVTEIATRKVLGGSTRQIFMQFITESLVISIISILVSVVLIILLLPVANRCLFGNEPVYIISYTKLVGFSIIVLFVITLGTGVYPALVLSRISIIQALKNKAIGFSAASGSKILVVFQNVVTQALIICTIVIIIQVHFLRNTDIGFDRKSVITIPVGQLSASQKEQFGQNLRQLATVQSFSFCNKAPSSDSQRGATFQYNNRTNWEKIPARFAIGDSAYCKTFGLKIIAGRNLHSSAAIPEYLVNETMATFLEGKNKEAVIGKSLLPGDHKGVIVGVVKDFNTKSLIEPIEPSVILQDTVLQTTLAVKLSGSQTKATLNSIRQIFNNTLPQQVFSYQFVDEQIADLYKKEDVQQKLIWLASSVAILISSLGLIGLVSLAVAQRTKEVGIRKVLGATIAQISFMLSNDFMRLVLLSFIIAAPASYYLMSNWLQNFAYHIHISWWIFALAGIIAILVAVITIGFQTIKAAITNPVKSLKSE